MEIHVLKSKIHDTVEMLPENKLMAALNFLEDLQISDEDETRELLGEPGFIEEYRRAKEDIRTDKTVSWKDIKRDV